MFIVACDPGHGTGWAVYDTDYSDFRSWETVGPTSFATSADNCIAACAPDVVVIEKYIVTDRTAQYTQQTDALKYTGIVADECLRRGVELAYQTPADAKRFSTDTKLKALGWHTRTRDGHANDAARHLLRYLERNKLLHPDDRAKLRSVLR